MSAISRQVGDRLRYNKSTGRSTHNNKYNSAQSVGRSKSGAVRASVAIAAISQSVSQCVSESVSECVSESVSQCVSESLYQSVSQSVYQ